MEDKNLESGIFEFCSYIPFRVVEESFFGSQIHDSGEMPDSLQKVSLKNNLARLDALDHARQVYEVDCDVVASLFKKHFTSLDGIIQRIDLSVTYVAHGVCVICSRVCVSLQLKDCVSVFFQYQDDMASIFNSKSVNMNLFVRDKDLGAVLQSIPEVSVSEINRKNIEFLGSYLDFLSCEVTDSNFGKLCVSASAEIKDVDGSIYSHSRSLGKGKFVFLSSYSRTIVVRNSSEPIYKLDDILLHITVMWNLIRSSRDSILREFKTLNSRDLPVSKFWELERSITERVKHLRVYIFEASSESVCEWAHEKNIFEAFWSSWEGERLIESTEKIVDNLNDSVDREKSYQRQKTEKSIQRVLLAITSLAVISTGAQMVDFLFNDTAPDLYTRGGLMFSLTLIALVLFIIVIRKQR